jgi:metal-sulfur cluster biosynthetic enzyme
LLRRSGVPGMAGRIAARLGRHISAVTTDAELDAARDALRNVYGPELAIDVISLGLVYDLWAEGNRVVVEMTVSTPGCPVSESFPDQTAAAVADVLGPRRRPGRPARGAGPAVDPRAAQLRRRRLAGPASLTFIAAAGLSCRTAVGAS